MKNRLSKLRFDDARRMIVDNEDPGFDKGMLRYRSFEKLLKVKSSSRNNMVISICSARKEGKRQFSQFITEDIFFYRIYTGGTGDKL
jgi:hypothetical protein